ncbi:MAG: HIT domain-containing protein [Patescibacteria group bacterium]
MDCIFCKINRNEISSEVLFEDVGVKVFKDVHPSAPVHFLVVPKKHIESISLLTEADRDIPGALVFAAKKAAHMLGLEGYKLIFNVGRRGGQIIDHLHLHLLGGWSNVALDKELR